MMNCSEGEQSLYELVGNYDGSFRVFDKKTGFQTNHITGTRPGEWREVFSMEQKVLLMDLTSEWLERYGYDIGSLRGYLETPRCGVSIVQASRRSMSRIMAM